MRLRLFFESADFETAIRTAISLGGDSDTIAAIAGAVAGAYYCVPDDLRAKAIEYMDENMKEILFAFEKEFCRG